MTDQTYTVVHPGNHQPYHTDLHTATFLDALKRAQERTAYDAVFEDGRQRGRIAEGVAPQRERTVERVPFEQEQARETYGKEFARAKERERDREPSVGD